MRILQEIQKKAEKLISQLFYIVNVSFDLVSLVTVFFPSFAISFSSFTIDLIPKLSF